MSAMLRSASGLKASSVRPSASRRSAVVVRAGKYDEELISTAVRAVLAVHAAALPVEGRWGLLRFCAAAFNMPLPELAKRATREAALAYGSPGAAAAAAAAAEGDSAGAPPPACRAVLHTVFDTLCLSQARRR
jgi:hypothetical protein